MKKINFFWVPVDPLPIPDRVNLRKNYLRSVESGLEDPLPERLKNEAAKIEGATIREIEIPSYLSAFPQPSDSLLISEDVYRQFIENGELWKVSEKLKEEIIKSDGLPFTISPDHSVTYGAVKSAYEKHGDVKLIIFDAHLDTVSPDISINALHAGNFVKYLYEDGITSIVILGVQDDPVINPEIYDSIPVEIKKAYPEWKEKIKIYNIEEVKRQYDEILKSEINKATENNIYISIDIDFASSSQLWGVRFFEGRGLSWEKSLEIVKEAINLTIKSGKELIGIDFTEWDPLLMEIPLRGGNKDRVVDIFKGVVDTVKRKLSAS